MWWRVLIIEIRKNTIQWHKIHICLFPKIIWLGIYWCTHFVNVNLISTSEWQNEQYNMLFKNIHLYLKALCPLNTSSCSNFSIDSVQILSGFYKTIYSVVTIVGAVVRCLAVIDSVVCDCVHLRSRRNYPRAKTDNQLMRVIMTNVWGNYFWNHLIYFILNC